jgi:hypothetical protein
MPRESGASAFEGKNTSGSNRSQGPIGSFPVGQAFQVAGKNRYFASSMCHLRLRKEQSLPGLTLEGFVGLPAPQTIYTACEASLFKLQEQSSQREISLPLDHQWMS